MDFVSLSKEASTKIGYSTPPEFIVAYKKQVELAVAPPFIEFVSLSISLK
jgi:hypothetical protein